MAVNQKKWKSLSAEQQKILKEQAVIAAKYSFDTIAQDNISAMEVLKKAGVQFDMNPDIKSFKDKLGGSEYYARYASESWYDQSIVDQLVK